MVLREVINPHSAIRGEDSSAVSDVGHVALGLHGEDDDGAGA